MGLYQHLAVPIRHPVFEPSSDAPVRFHFICALGPMHSCPKKTQVALSSVVSVLCCAGLDSPAAAAGLGVCPRAGPAAGRLEPWQGQSTGGRAAPSQDSVHPDDPHPHPTCHAPLHGPRHCRGWGQSRYDLQQSCLAPDKQVCLAASFLAGCQSISCRLHQILESILGDAPDRSAAVPALHVSYHI